jgi:hypothetical protein
MTTTASHVSPSVRPVSAGSRGSARTRDWVVAAFAVGTTGLAIMAFFLWIYRAKSLSVPIGWDTARYLWRTELFRSVGLVNLQDAVPAFVNTDPARPAFPVVAASLMSLFGAEPFRLAAVLPSVTAAAVGLAAGGFVAAVLRRPAWELVVVAVGVGTSAFVVRLLAPESYQDNLFAAAVFMAASIPAALSVSDRRALAPAILIFGAGGVIHWAFFTFMAVTLLLAGLAYLPASWRRWRAGDAPFLDTPFARLGGVVAGAAALAAAIIYGVIGAGVRSGRASGGQFAKKLSADVPKFRFPITLPVAAMGAGSLGLSARRVDGRARFVLTFLLAWSLVTLAGYLGFVVFGLPIPAHRFLAFALPVPVLAVLGVLAVARLVAAHSRPLGGLVVLAALAAGAVASHVAWFRTEPWMRPSRVQQAAAANSYLEAAGISVERPVVFVIQDRDSSFVALMTHQIRALLPARRIPHAHFYAGAPEFYLRGEPTPDETGEPGGLSVHYFEQVRAAYAHDPVAVILQFFNGARYESWIQEHPESIVGEGVAIVSGPRPASPPVPSARPAPYRSVPLAVLAVGSLAALLAIGLGWTLVLLGRWVRPAEALAVAPAVGIAALVLGGVLLDRVGVRFEGAGGVFGPIVVALAGWIALAGVTLRRRRTPEPPAPPST